MSIKSKVKRCNKEIIRLQDELETERLSNRRLRQRLDEEKQFSDYTRQLENIVKFAITNHIGGLNAGMRIEKPGIEKMQELKLNIEYEPMYNSCIIRVGY